MKLPGYEYAEFRDLTLEQISFNLCRIAEMRERDLKSKKRRESWIHARALFVCIAQSCGYTTKEASEFIGRYKLANQASKVEGWLAEGKYPYYDHVAKFFLKKPKKGALVYAWNRNKDNGQVGVYGGATPDDGHLVRIGPRLYKGFYHIELRHDYGA